MKRFLISLALAATMFAGVLAFMPEEVESQIGYTRTFSTFTAGTSDFDIVDDGRLLDMDIVSAPCIDLDERTLAAILPQLVRDATKDLFRREVRKESQAWAEAKTAQQMIDAAIIDSVREVMRDSVDAAIGRLRGNADYYL